MNTFCLLCSKVKPTTNESASMCISNRENTKCIRSTYAHDNITQKRILVIIRRTTPLLIGKFFGLSTVMVH